MSVETRKTYCRFCLGCCAIDVDVEDGRPVALRGDAGNPLSGGYTCLRGRELITMHTHPERIRTALKRDGAGFVSIPLTRALDEIAARTRELIARDGPRAIATYNGSWAYSNYPTLSVSKAFHRAIGSTSLYSPMTLDQPAKAFMPFRFGIWGGGLHTFSDSDVAMWIGNNPLLSQYAAKGGLPVYNPYRRLQDALNNGLKLIVIDPRRTEVARRATLHLQPRPGEDATLLAGILRIILDEQRHDRAFCEAYVDSLEALRSAIDGFTPQYVARRCDVPLTQIYQGARLFADARRGAATTGTGPEMAPRGSLTEHLVLTLNTVCGRYYREGEVPPTAAPLSAPQPLRAEVVFPPRPWGEGMAKSRFRGLTQIGGEMPCNVMADEILTPGEGRIRALFCVGGNPMVAFPNQVKMGAAMDDLELLVAIDPWMSATAKRAHYILPPLLALERADATLLGELYFEQPYAHYTERVLEPEGEMIEEWEFYWELAQRLGVELVVNRQPLPTDRRPDKYALTAILSRGSRIPLATVREDTATQGGRFYPEARSAVGPRRPGNTNRFRLLPDEVPAQLAALLAETLDEEGRPAAIAGAGYTHLLTSRRIRQFFNSTGHNFPRLRDKGTTNYAYMHPDDLRRLGIAPDTLIEIRSESGAIVGVARPGEDLRPGIISMAHAFGDIDSDAGNVRAQGSSTNRLVNDETCFDPITGQARQSAIPVSVRRVPGLQ
ncbi:MAG: molybdopterin-dependent oxidoreductase [Gammaproteobacteria bacterium]|jgi:anaerobic selenocysteine-containing dehydrogenase|nr:molybdopterin-dependent oxidoreductase [Gammaproteobacteria bacterium]MBK6583025.1 molybdopterin-dependent oxidoreductase [Gammaproteobacteria bacterium]MBK7730106.1 molybdopterin-dependent oxidoreductase [Gammaproteobacteria bacterium]MBK9666043.1 molybdopterin-dependent oxidoreductase [Gammaproteobacteria bacterium]MBP6229381.1 molybdopterin-dependent oxidoreductase [Pseudomonadales bacterium]